MPGFHEQITETKLQATITSITAPTLISHRLADSVHSAVHRLIATGWQSSKSGAGLTATEDQDSLEGDVIVFVFEATQQTNLVLGTFSQVVIRRLSCHRAVRGRSPMAKKKADVREHPEVFPHVGLLIS